MKYCDNYVGVACVSGACPIAIGNDPDNDFIILVAVLVVITRVVKIVQVLK